MKLSKTIVVKTTLNCNIRCKYCYEFNRINNNILKYKLDFNNIGGIISRFATLFPESKINWLFHGGEPLLNGYNFFYNVINLIRYLNHHYNVDYKISIQTNGLLITDRLIKLLESNIDLFGDRIISISIDGPKFIDDEVRIKKSGESVHNKILNSINLIKKSNIDFTTIGVIGEHNINHPEEVFNFLYYLNPNFIKLIPCYNFDKNGSKINYGISPLEYSNFMCIIFDKWMRAIEREENRFVIDPFMTIISTLTDSLSTWCEYRLDKCTNFTTIYPDGNMWLCDNFNHDDMEKYAFLGNIENVSDATLKEIMLFPEKKCNYNEFYNNVLKDCQICDIQKYCRGGCVHERFKLKNISFNLYNEYCLAKKQLISYIKNAVDSALS